jgi:hypothetical protein
MSAPTGRGSVFGTGRHPPPRRRVRGTNQNNATDAPKLPDYQLYNTQDLKKRKRFPGESIPKELLNPAVLVLPHGQRYTQSHNLPIPGNLVGLAMLSNSACNETGHADPPAGEMDEAFHHPTNFMDTDDVDLHDGINEAAITAAKLALANDGRHQRRKVRQWTRWVETVIPSVVGIYLEYQRLSDSGRHPQPAKPFLSRCSCKSVATFNVSMMRWDGEWLALKLLHPNHAESTSA